MTPPPSGPTAAKRRVPWLTLGVLLLAGLGAATVVALDVLAVEEGLSYAIAVDDPTVTAGEPVLVRFSWTNSTSRDLLIEYWPGPMRGDRRLDDGQTALYDFAVTTESGQPLANHGHRFCDFGRSISLVEVPARSTLERTYDISAVYDLRTPGRYVLSSTYISRATGLLEARWRGVLMAPDVIIEVVPAEGRVAAP